MPLTRMVLPASSTSGSLELLILAEQHDFRQMALRDVDHVRARHVQHVVVELVAEHSRRAGTDRARSSPTTRGTRRSGFRRSSLPAASGAHRRPMTSSIALSAASALTRNAGSSRATSASTSDRRRVVQVGQRLGRVESHFRIVRCEALLENLAWPGRRRSLPAASPHWPP